jgi:hypothetical protein
MTEPYSISLIAITPAAFKPTAEALGQAMGHGGNEFTVAIGNPVTHYALEAKVTPSTAAIWAGEAYPLVEGFTHEQIDAIRSQLIISLQEGADPLAHFNEVLADNGLATATEEV